MALPKPGHTPGRKPGLAFAIALGSVTLIGPLAIHLFLPTMPAVKAAFGISDAVVELTFSITLFTMAIVTLIYGSLSDRYGRRPVLLAGLALFLIGSALSAFATATLPLILGRLIQAIGAGCGLTLTRAIARDAYGPETLVKAIAYLTMAYTMGPMIAPPLGGLLIDTLGWRSTFWFALAVGIVITVLAYFILYETAPRASRPIVRSSVLGDYAALFRHGRFIAFVLQSGCMSFSFFALAAASPFLMKDLLGRSSTEYGLYFMLFPLGYFTGNWISGRLSGKVGLETMVLIGTLFAAIVIWAQAALIVAGYLTPLLLFLPGGLTSFAQGLSLPNAQAGAMRVVPGIAGTAAGVGVFAQMFLSAVSAEAYGLFADGTALPMVALAVPGIVVALGAACASFVLGRRNVIVAAAQ